jgi:hypothetical protein
MKLFVGSNQARTAAVRTLGSPILCDRLPAAQPAGDRGHGQGCVVAQVSEERVDVEALERIDVAGDEVPFRLAETYLRSRSPAHSSNEGGHVGGEAV